MTPLTGSRAGLTDLTTTRVSRRSILDAKDYYSFADGMVRILLILSIVLFFLYAVFPLFGGRFSGSALVHWGSLSLLCVAAINLTRRGKIGRGLNAYDYVFIAVCAVLNAFVWFHYTISLAVSVVVILSLAISYQSYIRRNRRDHPL